MENMLFWHFSQIKDFWKFRNGELPIEFCECGIAGKVSKVVIFENTYFWITSGKSFIFLYLYSHIYSLFLKLPPKDEHQLYSCFSVLQ